MKEYRLNIPLFIAIVGVISAIISTCFFLATTEMKHEEASKIIMNYSVITIPLAGIWLFFERYGWRTRLFSLLRNPLNIPPNIRGRWEGKLKRNGEYKISEFVIEIKQTMTKIQVYTYSKEGKSESLVDDILTDKMKDDFRLCYLWEGTGGKLLGIDSKGGRFKGYTILRLISNGKEKKLVGEYFTDRNPKQTKGTIEVLWTSKKLKCEF